MRKYLFACILISGQVSGQIENQLILQEDVSRTLQTLSADEMMGRPANNPSLIEAATTFIEKEFKKIGLEPMNGLAGFRQQFKRTRIMPETKQILVDGIGIADEDSFIISDKVKVEILKPLAQNFIAYDSSVANPDQYFFDQAFPLINDTLSSLIFVAPEFRKNFAELKRHFSNRFAADNKNVKVFVLGNYSATTLYVNAIHKQETLLMNNLVGVLPGASRADEFVIFSAHYDHIGVGFPINKDSIANGADDDASGTTAVIELARYYQRLKNRNIRSLVFVAFTAEEIGGHGSQYFSQQIDPAKVVAMFNIEMIGKPSRWGQNAAFITGFDKSDLGAILQKNVIGQNFQFHPDPYPEQNLFYRSDNATLARLGVPAHSISTVQIDIDKYYHTVDDEFETIDMANCANAIRAIAMGAKSIVDGNDTPKRIDVSTVD